MVTDPRPYHTSGKLGEAVVEEHEHIHTESLMLLVRNSGPNFRYFIPKNSSVAFSIRPSFDFVRFNNESQDSACSFPSDPILKLYFSTKAPTTMSAASPPHLSMSECLCDQS